MTPEEGYDGGKPGHQVFCQCGEFDCAPDWIECVKDCPYCALDPNDPASHDVVWSKE